jgi:hypothetical protein
LYKASATQVLELVNINALVREGSLVIRLAAACRFIPPAKPTGDD